MSCGALIITYGQGFTAPGEITGKVSRSGAVFVSAGGCPAPAHGQVLRCAACGPLWARLLWAVSLCPAPGLIIA